MSGTASIPRAEPGTASGIRRLWRRDLSGYPTGAYRIFLLAIVVLANIIFTWTVAAGTAATTVIFPHFGMTLNYYSDLLVVAGICGALAAYITSFGDRWGRANMVVIGLLINAVFALWAVPDAPSKFWFSFFTCLLYLADGAIFVGTPALVRDFSPQMQRGVAMGFWTFGPVAGYFVLSAVARAYLPAVVTFANWQNLYRFSGYAALVMFVVCLFFLRELPAGIRSQRMAAMNERALVEARARGLDLAALTRNRWRQMLHVNTIFSPIAINLFLIIYFTAIAYFVFYLPAFLHFSLSSFNGIQEIYWGVNIVALVAWGYVSDRLRVRKPFMVLGSVGTIVSIVLLMNAKAGVSFTAMALILSLMSTSLACAYCPWFASFTETLEAYNPGLIATGSSLYGFATRLVGVPFGIIIPHIVGSPVETAAGWRTWFYVCIGCVVVFVPFIFTMHGHWSPAKARAEFLAHEERVAAELRRLGVAKAA
ncbi:MAG TPA: MFS transporter [Trebonia sp.]|jgi:MFS family permease|nr:MFS transporter [Trebonia sp.]